MAIKPKSFSISKAISLDKVGVQDVVYPLKVMDKHNGYQTTTAKISMSVDLPDHFRSTRMSQFLEILNRYQEQVSFKTLKAVLTEMKKQFKAQVAHIELEFPYFILKRAPVSGSISYLSYKCSFIATLDKKFDFVLETHVPVHTLCPCSLKSSKNGAHNQRAEIKMQIRMNKLVWIEDLVEIAERNASCPLFTLLKKEDEVYLRNLAYKNPKLVEDVVRNVAYELEVNPKITWYFVSCTSFESIHNHNAYAAYQKRKTE